MSQMRTEVSKVAEYEQQVKDLEVQRDLLQRENQARQESIKTLNQQLTAANKEKDT